MKIQLLRYSTSAESTIGLFLINGDFRCSTIEDTYHKEKIKHETRIPAGSYKIILRKEGGFHQRYTKKFPGMHRGMLWLQDVPNFTFILIHIGNTAKNSSGCILVGDRPNNNLTAPGSVGQSTAAYKRIYPEIAAALEAGGEVTIEIKDSVC